MTNTISGSGSISGAGSISTSLIQPAYTVIASKTSGPGVNIMLGKAEQIGLGDSTQGFAVDFTTNSFVSAQIGDLISISGNSQNGTTNLTQIAITSLDTSLSGKTAVVFTEPAGWNPFGGLLGGGGAYMDAGTTILIERLVQAAPPSIASGTTISQLDFRGGIDSDTVSINLYGENNNLMPMWNDFTESMGTAIQNAINNNQSLQITISGVTDQSPQNVPEVTVPYSWFNGTRSIPTIETFGYQNFYKLVFGLRNDLNIPNMPAEMWGYGAYDLVTGITWAISII